MPLESVSVVPSPRSARPPVQESIFLSIWIWRGAGVDKWEGEGCEHLVREAAVSLKSVDPANKALPKALSIWFLVTMARDVSSIFFNPRHTV